MAGYTTVEVTQEDLDNALKGSYVHCAVVVAIARTFPKATRISVDAQTIRFTNGPKRYTYVTPYRVYDYIVAFDAGDALHPFRFRLQSDQRLVLERRVKTDAGKMVDRASSAVQRSERRVAKVEADPAVSEAAKEVARAKVEEAQAHKRLVVAEVAAMPKAQTEKHPDVPKDATRPVTRPAPRRAGFPKSQRHYGHRVMRVNNPDQPPGDYHGPLDV